MPGKPSGRAFPLNTMDALIQNAATVAKYTNMTILAVLHEMPRDLYLLCLRNAAIAQYEQTEEGRQYLADAHRLAQTEPEYNKIRARPGYQAEIVKE